MIDIPGCSERTNFKSIYLLKNSYYVKITKLFQTFRDCSSVVARDGNNKVNRSRFITD